MPEGGGIELGRAVLVLEADIADLKAGMQLAMEQVRKAGTQAAALGRSLSLKVTLPLVGLAEESFRAYGQMADAMGRVNAVIAATGGAAGVTAEHIRGLAGVLQETTRFSQAETVAAAGMLLTFSKVRNEVNSGSMVFDRALTAAQDMAAVMGRDLRTSAFQLGRALESPATGLMLLRRAGIVFTATERQQIKILQEHGKILEAQNIILAKVESRMRGAAKAMADTPLGHFTQMWNAVHDAMESIGEVLAPIVIPFMDAIKTLAKAFRDLDPALKLVIIGFGAILASIGPLLIGFAKMVKLVAFVKTFVELGLTATALKASLMALLNPISLLVIAVGVLTALFIRAKIQAWEVAQATEAATTAMITGISSLKPEQVRRQLSRYTQVIDHFVAERAKAQEQLATAEMPDMSHLQENLEIEHMPGAPTEGPLAAKKAGKEDVKVTRERVTELDKLIARLKLQRDALAQLAITQRGANKQGADEGDYMADVAAAGEAYNNAIVRNKQMTTVLGDAFDEAGARSAAFDAAIQKLPLHLMDLNTIVTGTGKSAKWFIEQGQIAKLDATISQAGRAMRGAGLQAEVLGRGFDDVGVALSATQSIVDQAIVNGKKLDDVVGKNGETLRELILRTKELSSEQALRGLDNALRDAANQEAVLGLNFDLTATQAQAWAATVQTLIAMHYELDERIAGTNYTLRDYIVQLQNMQEAAQWSQALRQTFEDGLDAVVEFAFGAKQSIEDFVKSALKELLKLQLRIQAFKWLSGLGKGNGGGGDVLDMFFGQQGYQSGGFLPPGGIGLVGEVGPELVRAGPRGLSVMPLVEGGGGGGVTVPVQVNVAANDQRGVTKFFTENEGLVANAMLRAVQRSRLLREALQR